MEDARSALTDRLGVRPLHRIEGGGYTLMEHWLVELGEGTRAFAKVAVDEPTAGCVRDEHRVYSQVEASFLPDFLGWDDDGERPILLLEDLTGAHWPLPWREGDVAAVFDALDQLHETPPPPGLPSLTLDELHTWREVEENPEPFLSLGLCSASWLEGRPPRAARGDGAVRDRRGCVRPPRHAQRQHMLRRRTGDPRRLELGQRGTPARRRCVLDAEPLRGGRTGAD